MKRTYFVPICVFAAFFLLGGAACLVMSVMLTESLDKLDGALESRFRPPGVYHLLYHEAHELRLKLSRHQRESARTTMSALFLTGIICLGWALDRRRLVRALNASSEHEKEAAGEDG